MATVKVDLVSESALNHTASGWHQTRVFMVEGLAGDPSMMHYLALTAPGIPARLDQHPTIPVDNFKVRELEVTPYGGTSMKVRATYRKDYSSASASDLVIGDPVQIETFGTLESTTTDVDKTGTTMTVDWTDSEGGTHTSVAELSVMVPRFGIRYTRRESGNPSSAAATYTGKVNSSTFAGKPARTWLCGSITGRSDDGGETSIVRYELFYNSDTWKGFWMPRDPYTNELLSDYRTGFYTYPEIDLNGLGL
jgi:hypothetical protein